MKRLAIVLAGGKGTRMKSTQYKVLHKLCGLSMVEHVVRSVRSSEVERIVTIVGHGGDEVKSVLGNQSEYAIQSEQLGTGHATLQARELLWQESGNTLVICGDTPLLSSTTLRALFDYHETNGSVATILTATVDNPTGYGRIVRNAQGEVVQVVEQKDATLEQLSICEINTGTYVFDNRALFEALQQVTNDNAQGEYYLTDVIGILSRQQRSVSAYCMEDVSESIGINDRMALSHATETMQQRIITEHMKSGVTFIRPATTYVEVDVQIGEDTVIEPNVVLKGRTTIGSHCMIGANSEIVDSQISSDVVITQSVIEESTVQSKTSIGPYAHLRPNSHLGREVHIGNFVEVKNSTIGDGTKSGHLTYIGDSDLGKNINVGCGTIFVNYDGKYKHRSTVGDDVFIGCNANIVSPVHIDDKAFIAAGTTVTQDVPTESLALSRVKQTNIPNYWHKFSKK